MIKVGIYDSDILILSEMENLLLQLESVRKIFIDIDVFNEKSDFLSHMNDEVYDLIYLSIQDDYKEIIAIAQEAKDYNPHVTIIYLAEDESLWKLLLEEAHMFRLITKPIDHNFFCKCFMNVYDKMRADKNYFEYKYRRKLCRVIFNDILFFESSGRYIIIHTKEEETKMIGTLNTIECQISTSKAAFCRVHQSYLVNEKYIKNIERTSLLLFNGTRLPISKRRYQLLKERL
jgi:Response regulator of the LytR/AlgR family